MTFAELEKKIALLSDINKAKPAVVWPPDACPAASQVPVTDLVFDGAGQPVISTGKQPS